MSQKLKKKGLKKIFLPSGLEFRGRTIFRKGRLSTPSKNRSAFLPKRPKKPTFSRHFPSLAITFSSSSKERHKASNDIDRENKEHCENYETYACTDRLKYTGCGPDDKGIYNRNTIKT